MMNETKRGTPLAVMALALLLSRAATAHARLTRAEPASDSTVATAPASLELDFNEAAKLTALSIERVGDKSPQKLAPLPAAAASHFSVPLPKLAAGVYLVRYRVLSDDSHVMSGQLRFTVSASAH
jgi:methionine-rich copper-binding protein CopC